MKEMNECYRKECESVPVRPSMAREPSRKAIPMKYSVVLCVSLALWVCPPLGILEEVNEK
jgi:hypothetical protein